MEKNVMIRVFGRISFQPFQNLENIYTPMGAAKIP